MTDTTLADRVADRAGIPTDARKWSAAQIDGVVAWVTAEPEGDTQ